MENTVSETDALLDEYQEIPARTYYKHKSKKKSCKSGERRFNSHCRMNFSECAANGSSTLVRASLVY